MKSRYTRRQIVEAIRTWRAELRRIDEAEMNESIKNTVLKWFGVKSNFTEVEDYIDLMINRKSASPEGRKLLAEIAKNFRKTVAANVKKREAGKELDAKKITADITREFNGKVDSKFRKKNKDLYERALAKIVEYLLDKIEQEGNSALSKRMNKDAVSRRKELERQREREAREKADREEAQEEHRRWKTRNKVQKSSSYSDFGTLDGDGHRMGG